MKKTERFIRFQWLTVLAAILFLTVMLTVSCHQSSSFKIEEEESRVQKGEAPLLWQVKSGAGEGVIYLFGSLYAADASVYPLRQEVEESWRQSELLAVSADLLAYELDEGQQTAALAQIAYPDGGEIQAHIDPLLYEEAVSLLKEEKLYAPLYDRYKPALWVRLLDGAAVRRAGFSTDRGIDRYFLRRAKNEDKEITEIETMEEQMTRLSTLSNPLQEAMLRAYVEEGGMDRAAGKWTKSLDRWKRGEMLFDGWDFADPALETEYQTVLFQERCRHMADFAEGKLKEGKSVFLTVEAAYMEGDSGLPALLRGRGCRVIPC
ncbi:MAG: TraB/GumN family protein [Clostridiales bacterium]|nr:TraB/GumN family protein [Clostridiales bacterium]